MKIGYLGPDGTFSEEAAKLYQKKINISCEMVGFSTIHDILIAADKKKIDKAIVPIENSVDGTIGIVTDTLTREVSLKITGELVLPVYHYLLAPKGIKLSQITDVISHPQPIEQCRDFLRKKLPKATIHLSHSTAEGAKQVAFHGKEKPYFAAIANISAAKLYGLSLIASKINAKDNMTRFVILSKHDHSMTKHDKSSIVFSLPKDRPGGLYGVLQEFAQKKINLTKIESRPSKKFLGDYYFFVDFQGHRENPDIKKVLKSVEAKVDFYKFLGSYPSEKY